MNDGERSLHNLDVVDADRREAREVPVFEHLSGSRLAIAEHQDPAITDAPDGNPAAGRGRCGGLQPRLRAQDLDDGKRPGGQQLFALDALHWHDDSGRRLGTQPGDRDGVGEGGGGRLQPHQQRRSAHTDDHTHREITDGADGHRVLRTVPRQSECPTAGGDRHGPACRT